MNKKFVLLTAARNEEEYLPITIEGVTRQSIRPAIWVIVDDGSTDQTAEIVRQAASTHSFIRLLSTGGSGPRSFGSKDRAINAAYNSVRGEEFDFITVLDADIAAARTDFHEALINAFVRDERLGIAGGFIYERQGGTWQPRAGNSTDSVAGGYQMFRRACYDEIGGYTPLHLGGEDWLAQIDARMAGWNVSVLDDQPLHHYRTTSTAGGMLRGLFRLGMMDASFGSHPLFQTLKCARRLKAKPWVLGALLRYAGYLWCRLSFRPLEIPSEKAAYLRTQQLRKIHSWWSGKTTPRVSTRE